MYKASALPQELRASMLVDTQALDLSSIANATATSQRIHAGDTLNLSIVTGAEEQKPESWPLRVADDGTIEVPLVGSIRLAGLDLQTAQSSIRQASVERGIFRKPSVSITVESRQTNRVTVIGAVEEPGEYDLPVGNSNLLAALAAAGSVTEESDRFVEIRQPSPLLTRPSNRLDFAPQPSALQQVSFQASNPATPQVTRVDLLTATQSPDPNGYVLRDGAVVMVRKRPKRYIHVLGLVRRPDQFDLPTNQNVRVLDAIALAGGRTLSIADRILVVRQVANNPEPALIEVSIRKAKEDSNANLLLADGDVISVEETPSTFVLGTLQQFIRLGINGSVGFF